MHASLSFRSVVVEWFGRGSRLRARPAEARAMHGQQFHQIGDAKHHRVHAAQRTQRRLAVIDPIDDLGRLIDLEAMETAAIHDSPFRDGRLYSRSERPETCHQSESACDAKLSY